MGFCDRVRNAARPCQAPAVHQGLACRTKPLQPTRAGTGWCEMYGAFRPPRLSAGVMRHSTPRGITCAMAAIDIVRLSVAQPRGSECCLVRAHQCSTLSAHLLPTRWRGLTPPAQPSRRRRTARVLRILHESTLSRYFARPAPVASVTSAWNGRASGGILPHNPSRRIAGHEWLS